MCGTFACVYVRPAYESKKGIVDSGVDKNFDRCASDSDVDECGVSAESDIELRYYDQQKSVVQKDCNLYVTKVCYNLRAKFNSDTDLLSKLSFITM